MIDWRKKRVAVLGFGIEGQDICRHLLPAGAEVVVFDSKSDSDLTIKELPDFAGVKFSLGKKYLAGGLSGFDYVFRSPGFRLDSPDLIKAKRSGIVILSATKLFFDLCPAKIIGVTGTKGKGTTATLIYEILKNAGRDVFLAGNIGQPMLAVLPKLTKDSWVVLELSSFQLQDNAKSPHIAVVLFITSEHLDYHVDFQEYVLAKSQIVRHQNHSGFAVLNADDRASSSFAAITKAKIFYFSRFKKTNGCFIENNKIVLGEEIIGETNALQLRGEHNWDNVCAAVTASYLVMGSVDAAKRTIFSFRGLEHRLEFVDEIDGIKFYNDSFSTNPETAIAAIKSFKEPMVLIAGGSEKGSDFSQLGKEIARSGVKGLVLIGAMAERIREACLAAKYSGEIIFRPTNMAEAVKAAVRLAKPGWVVVLSPACASFDMFTDYKDRGRQFKKNVLAKKD